MWLIRSQYIDARVYQRVDRFCQEVGFLPRKFSAMLLVKGVCLHLLQGKSWRQIGRELGAPHVPIYNCAHDWIHQSAFHSLLSDLVEKGVVVYFDPSTPLTRERLESAIQRRLSQEQLEILFRTT